MYFVDEALKPYTDEGEGRLVASRHPAIGQIACAVSHSLAALIQEPSSWRIAALVGTSRLLAPYIGLSAAAHIAAAAAREYRLSLHNCSRDIEVLHIGDMAAGAVESDDPTRTTEAVGLILLRLSSIPNLLALSPEVGGAVCRYGDLAPAARRDT